eukprot:2485687-Rhodomonas_salina.1
MHASPPPRGSGPPPAHRPTPCPTQYRAQRRLLGRSSTRTVISASPLPPGAWQHHTVSQYRTSRSSGLGR